MDRGYRGHDLALHGLKVWITGAKRGVTVAIKKKLRRRNAVETVMGQDFLKGMQGDAINALLCGARTQLAQNPAPAGAFLCPNPGALQAPTKPRWVSINEAIS